MRLTLYRLIDDSKLDLTAFRKADGYSPVPTKPLPGLQLALYVKSPPANPPKWLGALADLVMGDGLTTLGTKSSSAVLLIGQGKKRFAVTYGSGFQALEPTKVVPGYGLRVAANAIAGAKVKSADTRMLASAGRSQRTVLPEASELTALGIEPLEEWVRQLSGSVADQNFAKTASGSNSLRLSIKDFTLKGLPDKLKRIESLHNAKTYKTTFGFLDNFKQLDTTGEKNLIDRLDAKVLALVRNEDSGVFFSAPEPFDIPDVDSYEITRYKVVPVADLVQAEVYAALAQLKLDDEEALVRVKVKALDEDGSQYGLAHSLRECLQAEVDEAGERYVLSAGQWFRVAKDYIAQVDTFLKAIPDVTDVLKLPAWQKPKGKLEDEGQYNKRVAAAKQYALLDKDNLHFGGHNKIEVCDLLTKSREMICVKRATRSSTLSHLFAQGSVSAALMYEQKYQDKVVEGLRAIGSKDPFGQLADWTIVYAIATEKTGPLLDELFFFSRMNLMTHAQDIQSRGIRVVVARISM